MSSVFTPILPSQCRTAFGRELRYVVRSCMLGRAMLDEQVGEAVQHVIRSKATRHHDRQAASRELVDDA